MIIGGEMGRTTERHDPAGFTGECVCIRDERESECDEGVREEHDDADKSRAEQ